jgi:hypothetical protein
MMPCTLEYRYHGVEDSMEAADVGVKNVDKDFFNLCKWKIHRFNRLMCNLSLYNTF